MLGDVAYAMLMYQTKMISKSKMDTNSFVVFSLPRRAANVRRLALSKRTHIRHYRVIWKDR